jgi:site-specific DNA-methyltransferase (adenine-specific)
MIMKNKIGKYLDTVTKIDMLSGLKNLPDKSIDLAIADPPYNLSKGSSWKWDNSIDLPGMGGDWDKVMEEWDNYELIDYWRFTYAWLSELKRVMKQTGSIWVHGSYHNIGIVNFVMQLLGIEIINEIVWFKRNAFPNLSGRRLTASHETIIWSHVGTPKSREYYFDYETSKNNTYPEDKIKKTNKQMRTVWDIPNNKTKEELEFGKHPTQKPIRLLRRMIEISSKPGDICLFPFGGAGSDCIAAIELNRRYIAFELEQKYIDISDKRIEAKLKELQLKLL